MDVGDSIKSNAKTMTMFRFVLLWCLLSSVTVARAEEDFENLFQATSANSTKCPYITGGGSGCYECYPCNSRESNINLRKRRQQVDLTIFDGNCKGTQVCCFSQADYRSRSSTGVCGNSNPQGEPRRVRESLRSVLPGQYPWRAWIYTISNPSEPLCAGVLVERDAKSLITLASCVKDSDEQDLEVMFTKNEGSRLRVKSKIQHPEYNEVDGTDDIAVLTLESDAVLPEWVSLACLPSSPPRLPSACIVISENDKYINTIIPIQNLCLNKTGTVHQSQICAGVPRLDYEPELGGGLFCDTQSISDQYQYVVNGIFAYKNKYNDYMYTNVMQYTDWLESVFDKKS